MDVLSYDMDGLMMGGIPGCGMSGKSVFFLFGLFLSVFGLKSFGKGSI